MKTLITSDPDHQNVFNGWSPLRWAPDYPGLAGKDLSPKGAVTGCTGIPNCWNDGAPAPDGVTIYDETDAMAAINRGDGELPAWNTVIGQVSFSSDNWEIILFGNNLTDEDAPLDMDFGRRDCSLSNPQGNFRFKPRIPREFGLRLNYSF